jgi:hypothetical protein
MERGARGLRELSVQLAVVLLAATAKGGWAEDDARALIGTLVEDIDMECCDLAKFDRATPPTTPRPLLLLPIPPFDAFHYFNSADSEEVSNCAPHVDPGILTLIPLAGVPGLAVRSPTYSYDDDSPEDEDENFKSDRSSASSEESDGSGWLAIEELAHYILRTDDRNDVSSDHDDQPKDQTMAPFSQRRLVTVLAGEVLETLTAGLVPAGEHKVIRPPPTTADEIIARAAAGSQKTDAAASPRFSLVFDLQVPVAAAALVQAEAVSLAERASRREAQPPLHVIQAAAGRVR